MAKAKYYDGDNKVARPGASKEKYSMAYAGMPEDKVMMEYPKSALGAPEHYSDTRDGLDAKAAMNLNQIRKQSC